MNALAGLMNPGNIGMALQQGVQQGRAMRGEMETRNALAALANNPDDAGAMQNLTFYNPEAGMQMQARRAEQQAEAQRKKLIADAAQGDKRAKVMLWGVDPDMAMKLDERQLERAEEGFDFIANAAFQIDALPLEQQAAAFDYYVNQGVEMGFDGLARYRGQYTPQLLEGLVSKAGQMQPFMKARQPDYQPLGADQVFVDVRNPAAVQQFVPGGDRGAAQPSSGGGRQVSYDQYRAILNDAGQSAADAFIRDSGAEIQVQTREQVDMLPSGTVFVTPDGRRKVKP